MLMAKMNCVNDRYEVPYLIASLVQQLVPLGRRATPAWRASSLVVTAAPILRLRVLTKLTKVLSSSHEPGRGFEFEMPKVGDLP
jgi:hypothetical protein